MDSNRNDPCFPFSLIGMFFMLHLPVVLVTKTKSENDEIMRQKSQLYTCNSFRLQSLKWKKSVKESAS